MPQPRAVAPRNLAAIALTIALTIALSPVTVAAQELDLSVTDADDIVALCGGDPVLGQPLFEANCAACHTLYEGEGHGAGPALYAVYGRQPGTAEGFDYSEALVEAGAAGLVWEATTLRAFLGDPQQFAPGSHKDMTELMSDPDTQDNVLTYMRIETTPPPPAPEDVEMPEGLLAMAGDVPYGEYLFAECAQCHVAQPEGGYSQWSPGLDREGVIRALVEYRVRARPNETMQIVAGRLGDEEIAALAAYIEELR